MEENITNSNKKTYRYMSWNGGDSLKEDEVGAMRWEQLRYIISQAVNVSIYVCELQTTEIYYCAQDVDEKYEKYFVTSISICEEEYKGCYIRGFKIMLSETPNITKGDYMWI